MIGKILLTLAVMALAYLMARLNPKAKGDKSKSAPPKITADYQKKSPDSKMHDDLRIACYFFLFFMAIVGGALYYYRWLDDHQLITVRLYSADQVGQASYAVYKYQLADRSFTTVDGRVITVADSDRMEIIGLND